jgi:hypothetical protein
LTAERTKDVIDNFNDLLPELRKIIRTHGDTTVSTIKIPFMGMNVGCCIAVFSNKKKRFVEIEVPIADEQTSRVNYKILKLRGAVA